MAVPIRPVPTTATVVIAMPRASVTESPAIRPADGICASSSTGLAASGTCGVVIRTTGPSSE